MPERHLISWSNMRHIKKGCRHSVSFEYADSTTQEILSYQDCLVDRPEEIYLTLLKYFEPETDEFSEDFSEDEPFG